MNDKSNLTNNQKSRTLLSGSSVVLYENCQFPNIPLTIDGRCLKVFPTSTFLYLDIPYTHGNIAKTPKVMSDP